MMRAWGNRPDTAVVDEPFYAYYLRQTGADHPGAEEVITKGETDWRKVVRQLSGDGPGGRQIFYQKQMTHHLLPEIERDWLGSLTNCFLIRDPGEVIVSYIKKNHEPTALDLGFMQQGEIYDWVCAHADPAPPVLDARDVLEDPKRVLRLLCGAIGVEFSEAMLNWPPGLRETDGVWARHWYSEVVTSTSFRRSASKPQDVPARLASVYHACLEVYERLRENRLR